MELPKELTNEIWDYCRANNITNIQDFTIKLIRQGFTVEKFGATPTVKTVEKIVEKIVEVPVEKIVEKRIEVPGNMVDTDLSDSLKKYMKLYEDSQAELTKALLDIEGLRKNLEINKNKKDIYGE